jgi:hypothetical protein
VQRALLGCELQTSLFIPQSLPSHSGDAGSHCSLYGSDSSGDTGSQGWSVYTAGSFISCWSRSMHPQVTHAWFPGHMGTVVMVAVLVTAAGITGSR